MDQRLGFLSTDDAGSLNNFDHCFNFLRAFKVLKETVSRDFLPLVFLSEDSNCAPASYPKAVSYCTIAHCAESIFVLSQEEPQARMV